MTSTSPASSQRPASAVESRSFGSITHDDIAQLGHVLQLTHRGVPPIAIANPFCQVTDNVARLWKGTLSGRPSERSIEHIYPVAEGVCPHEPMFERISLPIDAIGTTRHDTGRCQLRPVLQLQR